MTYDFRCLKCKHVFEKILDYVYERNFKVVVCPKCGGKTHKRLITAPAKIVVPPWH